MEAVGLAGTRGSGETAARTSRPNSVAAPFAFMTGSWPVPKGRVSGQYGCLPSWHSFRRTFATLRKGSGEDIKRGQGRVRRANSRSTLEVYAQDLTPAKRAAHPKISRNTSVSAGSAFCSFAFPSPKSRKLEVLECMERPMRIELTPEPWQGSVLPLY